MAYENGLKQKQILHDFDVTAYKQLNHDLQHMTDKEATNHYKNYGFYENRKYKNVILPSDFDVTAYKKLNYDLQDMTDKEAMNHYKNLGFYEERKYKNSYIPDDFDVNIYKQINNDLRYMTDEEACNHYASYGFYEGRKYYSNLHNILSLENPSDISMFLNIPVMEYSKKSFMKETEINENIPRCKHNIKEKINVNLISSCILVIDFHNGGGGTTFFIESIISRYKKYQTFLLARNFDDKIYFTINDDYELEKSYTIKEATELLFNNKEKIEKIFVNHTLNHNNGFIDSLFNLKKHITTITHDFSILFNDSQMYFNDMEKYILNKNTHNTININKYDQIITQHNANLYIYNNFIEDKNKIMVTPLPDYINSNDLISTSNDNITIGIIGGIIDFKGRRELEKIISFYKNTNVTIVVFGNTQIYAFGNFHPYKNINELNDLLKIHKPNILIELSVWHETYSYTLTISMLTQLPILYLKKNGYSVIENRLSTYDKAYSFETIDELNNIIYSKKQNYFYTIKPVIYYNDFWDNYFITKKERTCNKQLQLSKNVFDINVYCIYFPQFHEILENNASFYDGFTDVTNLELMIKNNKRLKNIETPNLIEYNLNEIKDYNLTNDNIIQKQIDIIYDYNISGFAIYFYWFLINTITNKNLIMETVIDKFFNGAINMKGRKVFFIWANESWCNNDAFGNANIKIENNFSKIEHFENLIDNLIAYFKNDNYLKIDNKPVLSVHHPWHFNDNIDSFYELLNKKCIINNFSGVHFIVNSISGVYDKYINYHHNFNYKNSNSCFYDKIDDQRYLDYIKYINDDISDDKNGIQTLVFDFDNSARLLKPDKLNKSTVCINNTEINKMILMRKIIDKYNKEKHSDVENILLVNAWNEWGEKMNLEPSEEYGYYYLNLLNDFLHN